MSETKRLSRSQISKDRRAAKNGILVDSVLCIGSSIGFFFHPHIALAIVFLVSLIGLLGECYVFVVRGRQIRDGQI